MNSDDENKAVGNPPSPCVRNCCLDYDDVCMGCFRSISEICAWHEAPDPEKVAILIRCWTRYKEQYETRSAAKDVRSGPRRGP